MALPNYSQAPGEQFQWQTPAGQGSPFGNPAYAQGGASNPAMANLFSPTSSYDPTLHAYTHFGNGSLNIEGLGWFDAQGALQHAVNPDKTPYGQTAAPGWTDTQGRQHYDAMPYTPPGYEGIWSTGAKYSSPAGSGTVALGYENFKNQTPEQITAYLQGRWPNGTPPQTQTAMPNPLAPNAPQAPNPTPSSGKSVPFNNNPAMPFAHGWPYGRFRMGKGSW